MKKQIAKLGQDFQYQVADIVDSLVHAGEFEAAFEIARTYAIRHEREGLLHTKQFRDFAVKHYWWVVKIQDEHTLTKRDR